MLLLRLACAAAQPLATCVPTHLVPLTPLPTPPPPAPLAPRATGDITITGVDFLPPPPGLQPHPAPPAGPPAQLLQSGSGVGSRLEAAITTDAASPLPTLQSVAVQGSTPLVVGAPAQAGGPSAARADASPSPPGEAGGSGAANVAAALAAGLGPGGQAGGMGGVVGSAMSSVLAPGAAPGANSGNAEQPQHAQQHVSFSFVARKGGHEQQGGAGTGSDTADASGSSGGGWAAVGVGVPEAVWLNGLHCPAASFPYSSAPPEGQGTQAPAAQRLPDAQPLLTEGWPQVCEGVAGKRKGGLRRAAYGTCIAWPGGRGGQCVLRGRASSCLRGAARTWLPHAWPQVLRVDYFPILYEAENTTGGSDLFESAFTQMYIRCAIRLGVHAAYPC